MTNPTFKLRRTKDGHWECWCDPRTDSTKSTTYAYTPQQAIAYMEEHLADFKNYVNHKKGKCDPATCSRCEEAQGRGTWVPECGAAQEKGTERPVTTE